MQFKRTLTRLTACAVAVTVCAGQAVFAEEASGLRLRILSPRTASQRTSNDSVVFEAAGASPVSADKPVADPGNVKGKPSSTGKTAVDPKSAKAEADRFSALVASKTSQQRQDSQRPISQQKHPAVAIAGKGTPSYPTPREQQYVDAKSAGQKRQLALQRVNTLNQAAGPRDAGVPQRSRPPSSEPQPDTRQTALPTVQRPLIATEPNASQPLPPVVNSMPQNERMAPIPGAPTSTDPLASEIVRNGDSYTFTGTLNGIPVTFRINRDITGVKIPTRLASIARIIPPEARDGLSRLGEIVSPINSISFGAYPVRSVMAKIYVDTDEEYIDVGTDALSSFKIKDLNGRRMLVRS